MTLLNFIHQHRHIVRRAIGLSFIVIPCLWLLFYLQISWGIVIVLCVITMSFFYCMHFIPLKGVESKFFSGFTYFTFFLLLHIILFIFVFAHIYTQKGIVKSGVYIVDLAERGENTYVPIVRDYSNCLYFSAVTFTTLGFGDFQPTKEARGVAALEAVIGFLFLGFFVGMVVYELHVINEKHLEKTLSKRME